MKKYLFRIFILLVLALISGNCSVIKKKKLAKKVESKEKEVATDIMEKLKSLEEEKLQQEAEKKFLFERYYNNAYNEYINANYRKALDWIAKALEIYPNNSDALNLQTRIRSAMGEYTGEIKTIKEMLEERMKIQIEELRSEIRSQLKKAEELIKEEDYQNAKVILKILEEKLNLLPFDIGVGTEKQKMKELKSIIQKNLAEKERIEEMRRKEAARRLALLEEKRRLEEKKKEIKKLTKELSINIKKKNYIEARRIINKILSLDPKNKNALKILDIIRRLESEFLAQESLKMREQYEKKEAQKIKEKEIEYSEANIIRYPDRYTWENILKKSEEFTKIEVPKEVETPLMKEINKKLQEYHKVEVTEEEVNAGKKYIDLINTICLEKLRLSEEHCLTGEAGDKLEESITSPLNFEAIVPISEILKQILNPLGLTYIVNPFGLNIVPKAKEEVWISKVYNISDITNPIKSYIDTQTIDFVKGEPPEGLKFEDIGIKLQNLDDIRKALENTFTNPVQLGRSVFNLQLPEDNPAEAEKYFKVIDLGRGQIFLKAPVSYHKKLSEYMEGLRNSMRIMVSIEARFLAVDDNFLEDIGIDMRGLPATVTRNGQEINQNLSVVARDGSIEDVEPPAGKLRQPLSSGYIEGRGTWEIKARTQFPSATLSGQTQNTGGLGLQIFPLSSKQLSLAIKAVSKKEKALQLSAPRVIVFNNAYTYLRLIREITLLTKYIPGQVMVPETSPLKVGILLLVKPVVSYDKKYITLEIFPQIVRLQGAPREIDLMPPDVKVSEKPRAPLQLPWIVTQSAFTTVRVPDKGSIIIAGLRNILKSKMTERVPVLGRIPIVGALFKRKQKVEEKRNTVIILTAEILDLQEQEKKNY